MGVYPLIIRGSVVGGKHLSSNMGSHHSQNARSPGAIDQAGRRTASSVEANVCMAWICLDPGGTPPSPRSGHTASMTKNGKEMYVFGGYFEAADRRVGYEEVMIFIVFFDAFFFGEGETRITQQLYKFSVDTKTWTRLTTTGDGPRSSCSQSSVIIGRKLFVFGGTGGQCLSYPTSVPVCVNN